MSSYYTFELNENVNRTSVSYPNRYSIRIVADLYIAKDMDETSKYPALVIGPPYGGVKEQGPGVYANQLVHRVRQKQKRRLRWRWRMVSTILIWRLGMPHLFGQLYAQGVQQRLRLLQPLPALPDWFGCGAHQQVLRFFYGGR